MDKLLRIIFTLATGYVIGMIIPFPEVSVSVKVVLLLICGLGMLASQESFVE